MLQSGAAAGGLGTREAAAEAGHVVTSAGTEAGDVEDKDQECRSNFW